MVIMCLNTNGYRLEKKYYGKNNVDIYESPNAAADCARIINQTLIFIVSQVAIYGWLLSQLFYFVGFYILRVHLPCTSSEGGSFFWRVKQRRCCPHRFVCPFYVPSALCLSPVSFTHMFFVTRAIRSSQSSHSSFRIYSIIIEYQNRMIMYLKLIQLFA